MADLVCDGARKEKARRELTDEEAAALFDFDLISEHVRVSSKEKEWLVAATVLTCRKFNVNAFIDTIIGVWKPFKGALGRSIDDNLFVFEFNHERDMKRALHEGPWHCNNQLVVVRQINSVNEAVKADLQFCKFWIQILKLSPTSTSAAQAQGLGAQLGRFVHYDEERRSGDGAECVRLRVEMDISKPIRRGILTLSKGRQLWYDIRYEKLPNYCFWCGGFNHVERDCIAAFEEGASPEDEHRFANLKAEPMRNSFLKVANAQWWNGGGGVIGPRFVHRRGSKERTALKEGIVVSRDGDLEGVVFEQVSEFGRAQGVVEGHSLADPVLEKSLQSLQITPTEGAGQ